MRDLHSRQLPCGFNENDLIAEALGEATASLSDHVRTHLTTCGACVTILAQYRQLFTQLGSLAAADPEGRGLQRARNALDLHLARRNRPRLLLGVCHSPVGDIRVGVSDKGVALVEFARPAEQPPFSPRLEQFFQVESASDEISAFTHKLEDYLSGRRRNLDWIVDEALMRSDFQRTVLHAAADVPYGTVVTYQGIAEAIGQPKAVRAVAQALRYNPVPIHIPCHRVIGSDGSLTGYAGNLVDLKKRILAVEGVPVVETAKGLAIAKERMYVGWRHDRWFCRPDCSSLKDQAAGDRALISSRTRAEEMGYQPCDVCQPHIHPLA